jgi:hypothetical protein
MYKISILFLSLTANLVCAQNTKTLILITNPSEHFEIIGELGVKLGTTITVEGRIVEGPSKGSAGPYILIKRINNSSNQKLIKIPIKPYWSEFGEKEVIIPIESDGAKFGEYFYALPKVITGKTYRFRVYETGEYRGRPRDAYKEANVLHQTSRYYFKNELMVISGEIIKDIEWKPSDFVNQKALISGVSKNIKDTSYIIGSNWLLKIMGVQKWEKSELDKEVEVYGKIMETNNKNTYYVENEEPRLLHLEDMVNKRVKLRGQARSMNREWWFNYRGRDIYVEKMNQLPNWTVDNHFRAMEISGILKPIDSKDIDKNEIETSRYCTGDYIIVEPSWKPIDELLTPEIAED